MSLQTKKNIKKLEKGYIDDLENILKDISENYTLTVNDIDISYNDLHDKYIKPLIEVEKQYQCSALLVNGNRCSHKSLKETEYMYCKKHFFKGSQNTKKEYNIEKEMVYNEISSISFNKPIIKTEFNHEKLNEQFIDNKLYYLDEKFIYDNTYAKVGYIQENTNEIEYIFIDDPFILENL